MTKMMKRIVLRAAALVLAASVAASAGLAQAGGISGSIFLPQTGRDGGQTIGGDGTPVFHPVVRGGSGATSPGGGGTGGGASAGQPVSDNGLKVNPLKMSCKPADYELDGHPMVWLKNTGKETIPAPFWVTVTWPDGTTDTYKIDFPLKPGEAVGADVPEEHFKLPFTCGVKLQFGKPNG